MADKNLVGVAPDQTLIPNRYEDQGDGTFAPRVSPLPQTYLATNEFDPPVVPAGWSAAPRLDDRGNQYSRQSWRDVAASAYAAIIDTIGLGNLQLILPLWETSGGPYRSLLNHDKSFTGWNNVSAAQPGTLHPIVGLDGVSGYIQEDAVVANYTWFTYDTSLTGGTFQAAQQFIPTATFSVGFARIPFKKVGTPSANVKLLIYSDASGSPGTVITNGTSATIALSALGTGTAWYGFTFASAPVLLQGTTYWLVLSYDTPVTVDATDLVEWGYDAQGSAYGLSRATFNGTTWTVTANATFGFDLYDNALNLGANANYTIFVGSQFLGAPGTNGYVFSMSGMVGLDPLAYLIHNAVNRYTAAVAESGGVSDALTANVTPSDYGIWAITFAYAASTAKTALYRNGQLITTRTGTANTAPVLQAQPLCLGIQQGTLGSAAIGTVSNGWAGTVGPFILANTALTATQIGQVTNQLLALRRYQETI